MLIGVVAIASATMIGQNICDMALNSEEMTTISAAGCCDGIAPCTQCMEEEGTFIKCSASLSYQECLTTSQDKECGDCTAWNVDCGTYYTCTGGCAVCTADGACDGCSEIDGTGDDC